MSPDESRPMNEDVNTQVKVFLITINETYETYQDIMKKLNKLQANPTKDLHQCDVVLFFCPFQLWDSLGEIATMEKIQDKPVVRVLVHSPDEVLDDDCWSEEELDESNKVHVVVDDSNKLKDLKNEQAIQNLWGLCASLIQRVESLIEAVKPGAVAFSSPRRFVKSTRAGLISRDYRGLRSADVRGERRWREGKRKQEEEEEVARRVGKRRHEEEEARRVGKRRHEEEEARRVGKRRHEEEEARRVGKRRHEEEEARRVGKRRHEEEEARRVGKRRHEEEEVRRVGKRRHEEEEVRRVGKRGHEEEVRR
ncbi:hypothetical protein WMY93_029938 [Mugilogobius chulae]|uniref:Uncharacterized protein n=1 Tax=Mugilogobius chulae TaxID=88201 RepID=A0AAW0MQF7_9GOBI